MQVLTTQTTTPPAIQRLHHTMCACEDCLATYSVDPGVDFTRIIKSAHKGTDLHPHQTRTATAQIPILVEAPKHVRSFKSIDCIIDTLGYP